jgi:hypothetical protein
MNTVRLRRLDSTRKHDLERFSVEITTMLWGITR